MAANQLSYSFSRGIHTIKLPIKKPGLQWRPPYPRTSNLSLDALESAAGVVVRRLPGKSVADIWRGSLDAITLQPLEPAGTCELAAPPPSDYGSEGWGFESLRAHPQAASPPPNPAGII